MNGAVMESLALLVTIMLLVIFGAGFIAFGLSWFRSQGGTNRYLRLRCFLDSLGALAGCDSN
jgi:hypothetical protein